MSRLEVWTVPAARESEAPRLYALVSYQDADDVRERMEAYLSTPEFHADMEGFDLGRIVNVAESVLRPSIGSPLR